MIALSALCLAVPLCAQEEKPATLARLQPIDVFELEYASDPRIAPDGESVVYVRNFMDVMKDRRRSNLWMVRSDGTEHRPITTGTNNDGSPRWSPDGKRIAYVAQADGKAQLHVRWMDTGQTAQVTRTTEAPSGLAWSPDGEWLAFTMRVPEKSEPLAEMPTAPEGAEWAPPAKVIEKMLYRSDGRGYLPDGHEHVFVVPAEGGTPRQITEGPFDHRGPLSWTPDSTGIVFSANRRDDREREPNDTEVYVVGTATGELRALTDRRGPDGGAVVSPDGRRVAYVGFDDRYQGYQVRGLYVVDASGENPIRLATDLDRSVRDLAFSADGEHVYFMYDDGGDTLLARTPVTGGNVELQLPILGGTTLGRPYASGSYTVGAGGRFAATMGHTDRPADVVVGRGDTARTVTNLNADLLAQRALAPIEEIWATSSLDGKRIQAWIAKPPGFDPAQRYPMVLEIHGGPFANYGPRFSMEVQLYAAAGYVVVYANPRGSTSYGEEFGNAIHHAYPGGDYDDLMSVVDAVTAQGYVDPEQLYVTGGSGGGVLTAWIVGKTDRFRAAVVAKPVINWISFALTADAYNFFYRYWFPAPPWEEPEHYFARSPLSLVGNVTTPTMLLTGESDYRTPISESEQYYQALQLCGVPTAFVRIPEASHGIAARPSNLISKVAHVLAWFERYRE